MHADPSAELAAAMTRVLATMEVPLDVTETLETITSAVVGSITAVDHASISLTHSDGRIVTLAPTARPAERADEIQYELGEGPCVQAALDTPVVVSEDLARDVRWPSYGPAAARIGLSSQVAFQFRAQHDNVRGALNLYSVTPGGLDTYTMQLGALFATQVAITMGWEQHEEDLQSALATREHIGIAVGILMERYTLTPEHAFSFLVRISQEANIKLRDIALSIVTTAQETSLPQSPPKKL